MRSSGARVSVAEQFPSLGGVAAGRGGFRSAIFDGSVFHRRLAPVDHRFEYPVHVLALDLDELPQLPRSVRGFGHNRVLPVAIHDRDYLDGAPAPIAPRLRAQLAQAGVAAPPARLVLVTAARLWHYVFNPVSFYLGFDADDQLSCALAEVNNTFGDRHLYVLPRLEPGASPGSFIASVPKQFHVSPFNDLQGSYHFSFSFSADALDIRVDLHRGGQAVFCSRLYGRGTPLSTRSLWRTVGRRPWVNALTFPRILAQAAWLHYQKKLPVFARPEPTSPHTVIRRPPGALARLATRGFCDVLGRIRHGTLQMTLPDGTSRTFGRADTGPREAIVVHRWDFFTRLLSAGDVGLGEAYVAGDFTSANVTGFLQLLIANRRELSDGNLALAWLSRVANRLGHVLRANTRRKSRRNIHEHYDLGNAFFETFLDPSLMYSCAVYGAGDESLEAAQQRKIADLIETARIRPEHHILEIGSGWGSFAIEAARRTGCRVTSLTVSDAQHQLATERVRAAGLSDRVDIRLCDYRDIRGSFDRIVSIEMLEAVGHRFLGTFFHQCGRLLAPGGLVVLQVITIPDHRYDAYRHGCDWIQKHIFPGGHLPSLAAMTAAMATHSELGVEQLENVGPHYATTLRHWRERFDAAEGRVRAQGFDDEFIRKWRYYLAYCEAAFASRTLNTLHLVLTRPNNVELDAAIAPTPPCGHPSVGGDLSRGVPLRVIASREGCPQGGVGAAQVRS
ncbi:MAG: DUF1365 family protein [Lentisphaerae bacterium]|nr:DUF1365 family protein [Lentisphaerota bacterium]